MGRTKQIRIQWSEVLIMRFNDLIYETRKYKWVLHDPEEIMQILENECAQFLAEKTLLFRGAQEAREFTEPGKVAISLRQVRTNRWPRDTNKLMHYLISDWFKRNKLPTRQNSLGVFKRPNDTHPYGNPYTIWPRGTYNSLYFDGIRDFTMDIKSKGIAPEHDLSVIIPPWLESAMQEFLPKYNSMSWVDFEKATTKVMDAYAHYPMHPRFRKIPSYKLPSLIIQEVKNTLENVKSIFVQLSEKAVPNDIINAWREEIMLQTKDYYLIPSIHGSKSMHRHNSGLDKFYQLMLTKHGIQSL